MSPPKTCSIDEIGPFWTEERIIAVVRSIQNASSTASLPCDVIADINPYLHHPSHLPDGIWYVVYSEDPKQSEFGSWKIKGDPIRVYSDSSVTGCRTTLEFYAESIRTDWVMQEYSISDSKGGSSICRVFLADQQGESNKPDLPRAIEDKPKLKAEIDQGDIQLLHPDYLSDGEFMELDDLCDANKGGSSIINGAFLADQQGESKKPDLPQTNNKLQAEIKRLQGENLFHADYFSDGDFLELDDLVDTSSSSSGNSSCVTPSSDVYFDPDALLKQLGTDLSSNRYALSRPNDRVLTVVVPEGSPTGDTGKTRTAKVEDSEKNHIPKEIPPPPPPPAGNDTGASTSRQMSRGSKDKNPHRGKKIMKFFCFMAF